MNKRLRQAKILRQRRVPKPTTKIAKLPQFPPKFPQQTKIAKLSQQPKIAILPQVPKIEKLPQRAKITKAPQRIQLPRLCNKDIEEIQ
ncbi:putative beta antigen [Corchorus olitorius]|uniref:Beta antigen n=1 Tax=Corchorus olitorius TaxID=93759 RepID=A0A1R3K9A9_9ROSI|nr:putative beta antigen [Corchorus olitorius]